jgi:hypothetical protein
MHETGGIVIRRRFQRVAKRVAEIEQGPVAGLILVAGDHIGLGLARNRDGFSARRAAGKNLLPICFQPGKKVWPVDQAIFGDFGVSGAKLARWQRVERRRISQHQPRLLEHADQIFATRGIDAGLAADR